MAEVLRAGVAVIGAGPAGIAAATRAAEAGADVLVVDDAPAVGGQIWRHRGSPPPRARRWMERFARSGARTIANACAVYSPGAGRLVLEVGDRDGGEATELTAEAFVLATGARERFLPFPGWTLPNVFGAGAAQALVKSGVSFRGARVVVGGSGPLLLAAAAGLAHAGARVAVVAEQSPARVVRRFALGLWRRPRRLRDALFYRSASLPARYLAGVWISAASGEDRVREATLTDGSRSWTEPCDFLCCGYGLVANLELPILMNCAVADGRVIVDEVQKTSVPRIFCAGELTGIGGLELALVEGEIAGLAAAGRIAEAQGLQPRRRSLAAFASDLEATFELRDELLALPRPDTVVCRCEDVAFGRLDPSWSRRQAKLYTRVGMGPCQARICGPALELLFGWAADSIRLPLRPTPLSTLLRAHPRENPGEKEGANTR